MLLYSVLGWFPLLTELLLNFMIYSIGCIMIIISEGFWIGRNDHHIRPSVMKFSLIFLVTLRQYQSCKPTSQSLQFVFICFNPWPQSHFQMQPLFDILTIFINPSSLAAACSYSVTED